MQLLWWVCIHDSNVTTPFMTKMMAQNLKHYQAGTNVTTSGVYYTSGIPYNLIASPFVSAGSPHLVPVLRLVYTPFVIVSNKQEEA